MCCGATGPTGSPSDDQLGLPSTHPDRYRLLQRIHRPGTGRLSRILARLERHRIPIDQQRPSSL